MAVCHMAANMQSVATYAEPEVVITPATRLVDSGAAQPPASIQVRSKPALNLPAGGEPQGD